MSRPGLNKPNRYSRRPRTRRRSRFGFGRRLQLTLLFAVLLGVNAYVFLFRGGTSIRDLLHASSIRSTTLPPMGAARSAGGPGASGKKGRSAAVGELRPVVVRGSMKGYVGLSAALEHAGVGSADMAELIEALRGHLNLRALQPRHRFEVRLHARTRRLEKLTYQISPVIEVLAERRANGKLRAWREEADLDVEVTHLAGTIRSSLNRAITSSGESSALVARFVDLFSWDINWFTDPRAGDTFRIIVEKKRHDGKFFGYGKILAAEYRNGDQRYQAYHFVRDNGQSGYYTAEGRSTRRAYLKTPLNYRRISSRFNLRRFHPVLHRTKGHFGVDYAAPRGTRVKAAADGIVARAAYSRGAGNMVALRHSGGVRTVYMHLHRFAPRLRRGQTVRQGQLIGFVGATGLATGPHLHYGIYVRGRPIDPARFKVNRGGLLPLSERARFFATLLPRAAQLAMTSPPADSKIARRNAPANPASP